MSLSARSREYFFKKFLDKITYIPPNLSWLCEDCEPLGFCQKSKDDPTVYNIDFDKIEETEE